MSLMIAHFTTHQVFFMITNQSNALFLTLFFSSSGQHIKEALREERRIKIARKEAQKNETLSTTVFKINQNRQNEFNFYECRKKTI